jgi:hypothetical protein
MNLYKQQNLHLFSYFTIFYEYKKTELTPINLIMTNKLYKKTVLLLIVNSIIVFRIVKSLLHHFCS